VDEKIEQKVVEKLEKEKKVEETKTVLTPEEIEKSKQLQEEKKVQEYTNPYFPTLKLPYTSDWKFGTSTTPNYIDGLLNRNIDFYNAKSNIVIKLTFSPATGLDGGGGDSVLVKSEKIGKFTKNEYNSPTIGSYVLYLSALRVDSNINRGEYPKYNEQIDATISPELQDQLVDRNKITYFCFLQVVDLNKSENNSILLLPSDPDLKAIDSILGGFQF
jgi:hypothetical protein